MGKNKAKNTRLAIYLAAVGVCWMLVWQAILLQQEACSQENTTSPAPLVANRDDAQPSRSDTAAEQNLQRIRLILRSRGDDPTALASLVQLTRELPPAAAAELFGKIADDYLRTGRFNLAAGVLRQLVDQYPDQPAAVEGLLSLVRLYSSSEVAHAQQPRAELSATPLSATHGEGGRRPSETELSADNGFLVYALFLVDQSLRRHPAWANQPALAFQTAVALRRAGRTKAAQSRLTPLKHNPRSRPWRQCAIVETWLQGARKDAPPKPSLVCSRAERPPHLDGQLDEPFWQTAVAAQFAARPSSPAAADATQVRLAHDEEFLYLAVRCRKISGVSYAADPQPRSHDADLSGQDRWRLTIDLDRDYATWFQLTVDQRGWTADVCWRDATWNPRWFVAAASDAAAWTIEAAIPWTELADAPPAAHQVWALAIERRAPTAAMQTWVGPPSENPGPENFGLLLFD